MSLEVTCKRCGREFTTTPADVMKGPNGWRVCPQCREEQPPSTGAVPIDHPSAA